MDTEGNTETKVKKTVTLTIATFKIFKIAMMAWQIFVQSCCNMLKRLQFSVNKGNVIVGQFDADNLVQTI